MSEMDFAVMELRIALCNSKAVDRRLVTEKEREIKVRGLWDDLAKTSTQKRKMQKLLK